MAKAYANRVWMTTATAGTGTITLGSAKAGYLTFAEAGVADADTVTYVLVDGNDFEIGTGTYTSSGTTMSRDTVHVSKISGTAGTTKLTLSGSAEVFLSPKAAEIAFLDRAQAFTEAQQFTTIELGAASDTTLSRSSAGIIAVEGVTVPLNSTTNTHTAQQIELGHASDTTLARSAAGVMTIEGVEVVTLSRTQTLTSKTLTDPAIVGAIAEDVYTITDGAAFEIDPGNGTMQNVTLGASRTPKATNFAAGESVTLRVNDGSAYTLTWTDATFGGSGVVWVGGSAPTLDTTNWTVIVLWKESSQVYGKYIGVVA